MSIAINTIKSESIRSKYESLGVDLYYSNLGKDYQNPHSEYALSCFEDIWNSYILKNLDTVNSTSTFRVLDFACGDGLISKYLKSSYLNLLNSNSLIINGCDKYLDERYEFETGLNCFPYSFEDVANFSHTLPKYDLIVISYAIDLVKESYLDNFLYSLSQLTNKLLIIRPNNHLLDSYCWKLSYNNRFNKARGYLYEKII